MSRIPDGFVYAVTLYDTQRKEPNPYFPGTDRPLTIFNDELKWQGISGFMAMCAMLDYGAMEYSTYETLFEAHRKGEYQDNEIELLRVGSERGSDDEYTGFGVSIEGPIQSPNRRTDPPVKHPPPIIRTDILHSIQFQADVPNLFTEAMVKEFQDFYNEVMPRPYTDGLRSTLRLWGYLVAKDFDADTDLNPFDAAIQALFTALDEMAVAQFG
jgi:hypothetical protein